MTAHMGACACGSPDTKLTWEDTWGAHMDGPREPTQKAHMGSSFCMDFPLIRHVTVHMDTHVYRGHKGVAVTQPKSNT